ncbi:hypothetical protein ACWCQN_32740 [Streptomyces sp. NPDC001984]
MRDLSSHVVLVLGGSAADSSFRRGNGIDLRLILGDIAVRQQRTSRSQKIDMSSAARPYSRGAEKHSGMLADGQSDHLFARSTGHLGSQLPPRFVGYAESTDPALVVLFARGSPHAAAHRRTDGARGAPEGGIPDVAQDLVEQAIGGLFRSWTGLDTVLVEDVAERLAMLLRPDGETGWEGPGQGAGL